LSIFIPIVATDPVSTNTTTLSGFVDLDQIVARVVYPIGSGFYKGALPRT